jgi:hypothetical protein
MRSCAAVTLSMPTESLGCLLPGECVSIHYSDAIDAPLGFRPSFSYRKPYTFTGDRHKHQLTTSRQLQHRETAMRGSPVSLSRPTYVKSEII